MGKCILVILSLISFAYGIFVLSAGSGTSFWLIWELFGIGLLAWALLIHIDFFTTHRTIYIVYKSVLAFSCLVILFLIITISTSFFSKGERDLDYIIVLGAQVRETGPSVVLKYRLDTAIKYLNENPNTLCVVSGGQGSNEPFSEAEGMRDYLVKNGIDNERIILESKSVNTVENIEFSKTLLNNDYNGVGIVTNNFHTFRATQIAKKGGMNNVSGISADSNILYLPNNVLRECLGIVKDFLKGNI